MKTIFKIALIIFWFLLVTFPVLQTIAQPLTGKIVDKKSGIGIAFVSVLAQGTSYRTSTAFDGTFTLNEVRYPLSLKITDMGYNDTIFRVASSKELYIELSLSNEFKKGKIEGDFAAISVMKKVIFNRGINDPESNYPFKYKSYSKMVFGPVLKDTVNIKGSQKGGRNRYRFISETVTERKFFPPDFSYEKVLGNRFSGLLEPDFTVVASDYQPFSFYKDYVNVLGLSFLSPIARKSYKNYDFVLVDSYYENKDTLYVIQFQPKNGKTFNGLKGIMTITSKKYAVINIIVKQSNPYSQIEIELEQISEYIKNLQWFPVQFNTHLVFKKKNNKPELGLVFVESTGQTFIRDIELAAKIVKEDFKDLGIILTPKSNKHTKQYWVKKREEQLSELEVNTYKIVDSLGKINNYDEKQLVAKAIPHGQFPIGPVSIEMAKVVDYNNYEGLRLGVGIRTNDKVSKHFSVGGYSAWGLNDKKAKFGADLRLNISNRNHVFMGVKYKNDVMISGGNYFYKPKAFRLRTYSDIYTARMDKIEGYEAYFSFRVLRDVQSKMFFSSYSQSNTYGYFYETASDSSISSGLAFQNNEVGISLRFGFREKYAHMLNQSVSLGTRFPYVWFKVAYSDPSIGSTFKYTKLDLKVKKSYKIKGWGELGFMALAGTTVGDAPASLLHYGRGVRSTDLGLYIENAFNTMLPNEFLSDKYISLHLHFNVGALYKSKYSAPELSLVASSGWGSLETPEVHQGIVFNTLEKGFYETGLVLDNIFVVKAAGIGAGVFYRLGEYAFDNTSQNLATRISLFYRLQ